MTVATTSLSELENVARKVRRDIIRAVDHAKGGHIGGPLSAVEVLVALYFRILRIRPDDPAWPDRDRFILSKGHSSMALYAVMAHRGYFATDELLTFDAIDSRLQGHPDMLKLPGLDMSTGSLGLGFSAAIGMALGARHLRMPFTTYVMVGDGECNEGSVWEGAHVASRYGLDNLVAIVDSNRLQQFGWRGESPDVRLEPYREGELAARWAAFGWTVVEVDGHDLDAVLTTFQGLPSRSGSPVVVIANTIKGKGVSFMENDFSWHSRVPTEAELATAMAELGAEGPA
jgi:transketolase